MMQYNGILEGINIDSVMFSSAKNALADKYDRVTMVELLSFLKEKKMYDEVIRLIIGLFKDKKVEDSYILILTEMLSNHFPYEKWAEYQDALTEIFTYKMEAFNRQQALRIGHCLEAIYAKGFISGISGMLHLVYDSVSVNKDVIFDYLNAEDIRIYAASIAYSCNRYNMNNSISMLKSLKSRIKTAKADWLKPIVNYYIGICNRYSFTFQQKGEYYYINKSRLGGFSLAGIYIKHFEKNSETSKVLQKS